MATTQFQFTYQLLENSLLLPERQQVLVEKARMATQTAYAPYSNFCVAAVAQLITGQFIIGTNQENASYPVGICAERTLLSVLATQYPNVAVQSIAISYRNLLQNALSDQPASPCGLCRQSLVEYEVRLGQPIQLLLTGQSGQVLIIEKCSDLLPFGFSASDMLT